MSRDPRIVKYYSSFLCLSVKRDLCPCPHDCHQIPAPGKHRSLFSRANVPIEGSRSLVPVSSRTWTLVQSSETARLRKEVSSVSTKGGPLSAKGYFSGQPVSSPNNVSWNTNTDNFEFVTNTSGSLDPGEVREFQDLVCKDLVVQDDFISESEEKQLLNEVKKYLKKTKYEYDHWDGVKN